MIGIHLRSGSYSDRWVEDCLENGVSFISVDCLANDVIDRCCKLDAVLWHWAHDDYASRLAARHIIISLERLGILVYPSWATCWHFDDKIAQKYLLEALGAPIIPTWVFFRLEDAVAWIQSASWPKVWKLRSGAGSMNVRLVHGKAEAYKIAQKSFSRGIPAVANYLGDIQSRFRKALKADDKLQRIRRVPSNIISSITMRHRLPYERGYVYFQEFLANNTGDIRITIIGERAFGFSRRNRTGDFRASGSGLIDWNPAQIDPRSIQIAFRVAHALKAQSLAFDFLSDGRGDLRIAEISYAFDARAVERCPGHWDTELKWHDGHFWPQDVILQDILDACRASRRVSKQSEI